MKTVKITIKRFDADPFTLTWFYRALKEKRKIDIADRFMCLWVCFNSIIRKKYGEHPSDRTLIEQAKRDHYWTEVFKKVWENPAFVQLFIELKTYSVRNMRYEEHNVKEIENDCFADFIEVVYQIRNNLFHGRKKPQDTGTEDYELIVLAYQLLTPIIITHLENEERIKEKLSFKTIEFLNGIPLDF